MWEHTLSDGTTTWVAQPDTATDASRIPGFQSREWAGEFLYEREWPKFVHREDPAADVLPQPGCTVRNVLPVRAGSGPPRTPLNEQGVAARMAPGTTTCRARAHGRCVPARGAARALPPRS